MNVKYAGLGITNELGRQPLNAAFERNPLALGQHCDFVEDIDGVAVNKIVEEFGTPLFVISEKTLRAKADRMRNAFRSLYPRVEFAWSLKTNPIDAVCAVLHSEGWGAEVVSSHEYLKARNAGFDGREIIFNGPYKKRSSLERALREGAMVQIDNWEELGTIEEVAREIGGVHDVGIRVQIATGYAPNWTKFGLSLQTGEASQAALRVIRSKHLRLHTLHCHIGTYLLDPQAYRVATQALIGLREALREETGHLVDCVNLGGGFPSDSLLHGMAGPAEQVVPRIERYAEVIANELNKLPARRRPLLRLESGRFLIDNACSLLTSIVAVKEAPLNSGNSGRPTGSTRPCYFVDSGINLLYTAAWFSLQVSPSRPVEAPSEPARLVGDLCMEIDVIREQAMLPRLDLGDTLVIHPVGAYNFNQSMDFIHLRPAVVMVSPDGGVHTVRRRERIQDFAPLETLPAHLTKD